MGQLGDELLHERRHDDRRDPGLGLEAVLLLPDDRHLVLERARVVRPDLRAQAVLERRDDPAARGVVLRVGRRDHVQVERQAHDEAADLDVAFLEDVEQADLDPFGEVGQLVDRDDPAVGARDQAVVERQDVRQVAALGDLDRVDFPDQVGDRDVRRGQLLGVSTIARQPVDRGRVAFGVHDRLSGRAGRSERVVVELPAAHDRQPIVEEADEEARHPRLGLAALAEEHEILAGEDRVLDGRHDGLLVPDDARQDVAPDREAGDQVGAQLLLDGPRPPIGGTELTQGRGAGRGGHRKPQCDAAVDGPDDGVTGWESDKERCPTRAVRTAAGSVTLVPGESLEEGLSGGDLVLEVAGGHADPQRELRGHAPAKVLEGVGPGIPGRQHGRTRVAAGGRGRSRATGRT